MKLTDKRFWILLTLMVNATIASAQAFFSVEEISKSEYVKAGRDSSRYNIIPADSITDNEIISMILKETQNKYERLDTALRQDIDAFYGEEFRIDKQRLIYFPELELYGFVIPENPFDDNVWWFDAESGKYLCEALAPNTMNTNGMYVSQTGHDCDWPLDLKFFQRVGDFIYEFQSYKNSRYNGETVVYQNEDNELTPIFWGDNNMLFLKTYDHQRQKEVFLRIKVQLSVRDMLENMMRNEAVRPAPIKSVRNNKKGGEQ